MSFDTPGGANVGGAYFGLGFDFAQLERDLDRAESIARDRARRIQQQFDVIQQAGDRTVDATSRVAVPRPINVRQQVIVSRFTRVVDAPEPAPPRAPRPQRQSQEITVDRRYSVITRQIPLPPELRQIRQTQNVDVTRTTRITREGTITPPPAPPHVEQHQQIDVTRSARVTEANTPPPPAPPPEVHQRQRVVVQRTAQTNDVSLPAPATPRDIRQRQRIYVERSATVSGTPSLPAPPAQPQITQTQNVAVNRQFHLEQQQAPHLPPLVPERTSERQEVDVSREARLVEEARPIAPPTPPPTLHEQQEIEVRRAAHITGPSALPAPVPPAPVQQTQNVNIRRHETATTQPVPPPVPPQTVQQTQEIVVHRSTRFEQREQQVLPPAPTPQPINQTQQVTVRRSERVVPAPQPEPPVPPPPVTQRQEVTVDREVHTTGGQLVSPPAPPHVRQTQEIDVQREAHVVGEAAVHLPQPNPQQPIHQTQQVTVQRQVTLEQRAQNLDLPAPPAAAPVQQTQEVSVRRSKRVVPTPEIAPPASPPPVNQTQEVTVSRRKRAKDEPLAEPQAPAPVQQTQDITVVRRRRATGGQPLPAPVPEPPVQQTQEITVNRHKRVGRQDATPPVPPAPPAVQQEQPITIDRKKRVVTEPTPPPAPPAQIHQEQGVNITRVEEVGRVVPPPVPAPPPHIQQQQTVTVDRKFEVKEPNQKAPEPPKVAAPVTQRQQVNVTAGQVAGQVPAVDIIRTEFNRIVGPVFERIFKQYAGPDAATANIGESVSAELGKEFERFSTGAARLVSNAPDRQRAIELTQAHARNTLTGLEVPSEQIKKFEAVIERHAFLQAAPKQQVPTVVVQTPPAPPPIAAPTPPSTPPAPPEHREIPKEPSPSRHFNRPVRNYAYSRRGDPQQMQVGPEGATVTTFLGSLPPEQLQITREQAAQRLRYQRSIQFQKKPPSGSTVPERISNEDAQAHVEAARQVQQPQEPEPTQIPESIHEPPRRVEVPPTTQSQPALARPVTVVQVHETPRETVTPAAETKPAVDRPALSQREYAEATHLLSMETAGRPGRQFYVGPGQLQQALEQITTRLQKPNAVAYLQQRQPSGEFGADVRLALEDVQRQLRQMRGEPEPTQPVTPARTERPRASTTRTRTTTPPAEQAEPQQRPASEQTSQVRLYRATGEPVSEYQRPTTESERGRSFSTTREDAEAYATGPISRLLQVDVPRLVFEKARQNENTALLPAGWAARAVEIPRVQQTTPPAAPATQQPAPQTVEPPRPTAAPRARVEQPRQPPQRTELLLTPKVDQNELQRVETQVQQAATTAERQKTTTQTTAEAAPRVSPIDPNLQLGARLEPTTTPTPTPPASAPPTRRQTQQTAQQSVQQPPVQQQAVAADQDAAALGRAANAVLALQQREVALTQSLRDKNAALVAQVRAAVDAYGALQRLVSIAGSLSQAETRLAQSIRSAGSARQQIPPPTVPERAQEATPVQSQIVPARRTRTRRTDQTQQAAPQPAQITEPSGPTLEERAEELRTTGLVLQVPEVQQPTSSLILPSPNGQPGPRRTAEEQQRRIQEATVPERRPEDIGLISAPRPQLIIPQQPPQQPLYVPGRQQSTTQPLILPQTAQSAVSTQPVAPIVPPPPSAVVTPTIAVPPPTTPVGRKQTQANNLFQQLVNGGVSISDAAQQVQSFFGVAPTNAPVPPTATGPVIPASVPTAPQRPPQRVLAQQQQLAQAQAIATGAPFSTLGGRLIASPGFTVPLQFQGPGLAATGVPQRPPPGGTARRPAAAAQLPSRRTMARQQQSAQTQAIAAGRPFSTLSGRLVAPPGFTVPQQYQGGLAATSVPGSQQGGGGILGALGLDRPLTQTRAVLGLLGIPVGINIVSGIARDIHQVVASAVNDADSLARSFREMGVAYGQLGQQQLSSGFNQFANDPNVRGTREQYQTAAVGLQQLSQQYGFNAQQVQGVLHSAGELARIHGVELPQASQILQRAIEGDTASAQQLGLSLTDNGGRLRSVGVTYEELATVIGRTRAAQVLYNDIQAQTAQQAATSAQVADNTINSLDRIGKATDTLKTKLADLVAKPYEVVVNSVAKSIETGDIRNLQTPQARQNDQAVADLIQRYLQARQQQDTGRAQAPGGAIGRTGLPTTSNPITSQDQPLGDLVQQTVQRITGQNTPPPIPQPQRPTPQPLPAGGLDTGGKDLPVALVKQPPTVDQNRIAATLQASGLPADQAATIARQAASTQDLKQKEDALSKSLQQTGLSQQQADSIAVQAIASTQRQTQAIDAQISSSERLRLANIALIGQADKLGTIANVQAQQSVNEQLGRAIQGPLYPLAPLNDQQADVLAQQRAAQIFRQQQQQQIAINARDDVRAQLETSATTQNPDAQDALQRYDQQVQRQRELVELEHAQAVAQNQQAQVQAQVDTVQAQAELRRLGAQTQLNELAQQQISIQNELAPMLVAEANLRDRITLATQQNLQLEQQRLEAQQQALPASQTLSELNYQEQVATQRAVVGQIQRMQGQTPQYDLGDQINTIIGLEYARPQAELANTEAQRPVEVAQQQQQAFDISQQLGAIPLQEQLQGLQRQEIPVQEAQRDVQAESDALQRAIQSTELANAPALIQAQTDLLNARLTEIAATLKLTQTQAAAAGATTVTNQITVAANVTPDPDLIESIKSAATSGTINALNQSRVLSSGRPTATVPGGG